MTDTPSAPNTPQAGGSGQPQAGQATPQAPQAGDPSSQQASQLSTADYERMIKELRQENASYRTKQSAYDKAQAEAEAAKLSDLEKAQKAREAAEAIAAGYKARIGAYEVRQAAQKLGIIDPELAALAIAAKLEYADDGTPTNADKLLADLLKEKPYLAPAPTSPAPGAPVAPVSSGGAVNPGRATTSGASDLTWERITAMAPQEYAARRAEILAFMYRTPPPKR